MKTQSLQFKVLITIISAMLAITIFIGGLSIYELDNFVQLQTEDYVNVTCEKDASQINDMFGGMEKSVKIMESYIMDFFTEEGEIKEVSLILSLDNRTEDSDKAFDDYLKVITERMNRKNIMNRLNARDDDTINEINKIIKNQS